MAQRLQCEPLFAEAKLALRRLASTVSIVTCRHDGCNHAMTATAVSALSMDPPSMLVCVNRSAGFHNALDQASEFAINILSARTSPFRGCAAAAPMARAGSTSAIGTRARRRPS